MEEKSSLALVSAQSLCNQSISKESDRNGGNVNGSVFFFDSPGFLKDMGVVSDRTEPKKGISALHNANEITGYYSKLQGMISVSFKIDLIL
jgi:DNA repair exonuclease SbcCD ATPase subunit